MKCPICAKEFTPKRADAKSCGSAACRKALQRQKKEKFVEIIETGMKNPLVFQSDKLIEFKRKEALARADEVIAVTDKLFTPPLGETPEEAYARRLAGHIAQLPKTEWLATHTPLDSLSQIPKDKITIIYGKFGIGKTTLANLIAAGSKLKTLYIDTEASLSPERLSELGVEPKDFDTVRLGFIEDVYTLLLDPKTLKKYDLIVWDSVGNTSFRTEVEGDAMDRNIGAKPLIMNKLMRILPNKLADSKTTLLLINQEREGIGMYAANYVPGGKGQMYSASMVIRLTGKYPKVAAEITKSRVSNVGKIEFSLTAVDRING